MFRMLVIFIVAFGISGCGGLLGTFSSKVDNPRTSAARLMTPDQPMASVGSPPLESEVHLDELLSVRIVREVNDGKLLSIVLALEPIKGASSGDGKHIAIAGTRGSGSNNQGEKEQDRDNEIEISRIGMRSTGISVQLSLFKSGIELYSRSQRVSDLLLLDSLNALGDVPLSECIGRELLLQGEVVSEVTDYQIQLGWDEVQSGGRNEAAATQLEEDLSARDLLREYNVVRTGEGCDQETECYGVYEIHLELVNPTQSQIGSISLDTWFEGDGGSSEQAPERSQLELTGVVLQPLETVQLRIKLTQGLPLSLEESGYRPKAEVAEFEILGSSR